MSNSIHNTNIRDEDTDEIDLIEVLKNLWIDRWTVISITSVFAVLSIFYALSLPNIYQSEALLAPNNMSTSGSSQIGSQLGGLASIAGVNLGSMSGGQESKINTAIEILSSRRFFKDYLYDKFLVEIMAAKTWESDTKLLVLDKTIYNLELNEWLSKDGTAGEKPSVQKAFKTFINETSINKDKLTGFVTVSYRHISPEVSQKVVEKMIDDVNQALRKTDIDDSNKSIAYLMREINNTSLVSLQQAFSRLIEEQTKTMMLANIAEEYVFRTIDPPIISELKSAPSRSVICIVITSLGGLFAVMVSFFRFSYKKTLKE